MAKNAMPVSKAKTAYGLLTEIRQLIVEEPKRYDQSSWKRVASAPANIMPACGTVCCVAGWVDTLKNPRPFSPIAASDFGWDVDRGVGGFARKRLGLSSEQADELFDSDAAGPKWGEGYEATDRSMRVHAKRGALHIARFQKKYAKQLKAKKAGYLLVPNMPVNLLAVRVNREKQPPTVHDSKWGGFSAKPQATLPAGTGRYVDESVRYVDESYTEKVDGKERLVKRYVTDDYDDVDFPHAMAKPVVLAAAARAMALKIFDQIGMVQNASAGDPILVGQLLDPRRHRLTTFFIAWWIDPETL